MWTTPDIDDLQGASGVARDGYRVNIRPRLMADDLKQFVVTPANPARRWSDDPGKVPLIANPDRPGRFDFAASASAKPGFATIFLRFPDLATAKATSLGRYWRA